MSSFDYSNCKIAICTPAYGGQLTTGYTSSLIKTIEVFNKKGIKYVPLFLNNESLVQRARNTLVAQALADPSITHILFIDSDITWHGEAILRLLEKDGDIVGGIYPHKHYAWERLVQPDDMKRIQSELNAWVQLEKMSGRNIRPDQYVAKLKSYLLKFNIVFPKNQTQTRIENGFVEVERIATGMMLIKREVFMRMKEAHPDWHYKPNTLPSKELIDQLSPYSYAFFDCKIDDGQYLSEDWYFCSEWKKLGGKVWADISMTLVHSGFHSFQGSVSDILVSHNKRLEAVQSQRQQQMEAFKQNQRNMLMASKAIPIAPDSPSDVQEEDPIKRLIAEAEAKERASQSASAPAPSPVPSPPVPEQKLDQDKQAQIMALLQQLQQLKNAQGQ